MISALITSLKTGSSANMIWASEKFGNPFYNYARMFKDKMFMTTLGNTFFYLIIQVPIMLVLAILLEQLAGQLVRVKRRILCPIYFEIVVDHDAAALAKVLIELLPQLFPHHIEGNRRLRPFRVTDTDDLRRLENAAFRKPLVRRYTQIWVAYRRLPITGGGGLHIDGYHRQMPVERRQRPGKSHLFLVDVYP